MVVLSNAATLQPAAAASHDHLIRNASVGLKSLTLLIYGPSGIGKSTQGVMLSKYCPEVFTPVAPGTPLQICDDVFTVSYDKDGMLCGLPYGLDMPGIQVNDARWELGTDGVDANGNTVRKPMPLREFHRSIMFPMIHEQYRRGVRNFVLDTLTSMVTTVQPEVEASTTVGGSRNNMEYWPALTACAQELYAATSCLPGATVLYLAHSVFKEDFAIPNKNENRAAAEERTQKKKSSVDPYLSKITLAMPGKTGEVFANQSSLVLAMDLRLDPKTQQYDRQFVVNPGETDHRAKNRFASWLNPIEPANIRAVIRKLQTAAGIV